MSSETKNCQNCKTDFTIAPEDFQFYEKIKVPSPTWCPDCRTQRRTIWRNEKTMYKRKCDATEKEIFTGFHPDTLMKVYDRDYWWSDAWDPMEYSKEYDFSKPFLEQLRELIFEVPWPSRSVINLTNSEYCMNSSYLKDCYFIYHATHNEGCAYSVGITNSKNSYDCLFVDKCELCYEVFNSARNYKVFYSYDCENSQDLYMCRDCSNCTSCIGSVGLRNKKFYIFNKQYTKEEYEAKARELGLSTRKGFNEIKEEFDKLKFDIPVKYVSESHNSNVTGDYIYHSKNVKNSYLMAGAEDCKFCQNILLPPSAKDCYDYSFFGMGAELVYECSSVGIDSAEIKFSALTYSNCERIEYSAMCPSSQDLFGCVGLQKKQYCILNKQYSSREYEEIIQKIKKHMDDMPYKDSKGRIYKYGEFFPPEFCPFGYNETTAQEYFPKTKKEALNKGWTWRDPEDKSYTPTLKWKELPDDIQKADESIIKEVILCKSWDEIGEKALEHNCTKAYRITSEELRFYKQMNLPLPERCFNSRHFERTKLRNPLKLWNRKCTCAGPRDDTNTYKNTGSHLHGTDHCPNEFETSYSPDRKEIVYCEQCYQSEVV